MYPREEVLRIASSLGCKYEDKCSNHTRRGNCPACLKNYDQKYCAHETMCPPCEAASALRFLAQSLK